MSETNTMHVLVYGTLRQGDDNHDLLTGAQYVCQYKLARYAMVNLGAFPAIHLDEAGSGVICELYRVDAEILHRLDRLEGYPDFYNRKQIEIDRNNHLITAWVYYMESDRLANYPIVSGGDWQQNPS